MHVKNPFNEIIDKSNLTHRFVAGRDIANNLMVLQVETDKSASALVAPECLPAMPVPAVLFPDFPE